MKYVEAGPSVRQLMKRAEMAMKKEDGNTAIELYNQVLKLNPDHVEALYNLGFIYQCVSMFPQAQHYYERCIQLDPTHIESYLKFTKLLEDQSKPEEAIQIAHLAAQMAPGNAATHNRLAGLLIRFNQSHLAVQYLDQILKQFPKDVNLWQVYCMALKINERHEEADAAYDKLVKELHVPFAARVLYETYLPRLYRSSEEIDQVRARFKSSLELFIQRKVRMDIDDVKYEPTFQLAFHNRDNRELMLLYTKMLRSMAPLLNYVAPHCKTSPVKREAGIKIGFISRNMHNHSVGACYRDVMIALAQQPEFAVTFFNINNVLDAGIQQIIDADIPIAQLPAGVSDCQLIVANAELDILVYPDIGMDMMSRYLAMARLAPYQLCLQGHPDTTGIDTMDYVVSTRAYEPPHADENHTERLLCYEGVDTIFKRPKEPAYWAQRSDFGMLPPDKKLYVCPMAIQKFHPDFDDVLADILAADPKAVLVLFQDFQQVISSHLLQERILKKCAKERVIFMPWLNADNLYSLMKFADCLLDTIYFGAGTTSQLAFHFGVPIVSMPGRWARGRMVNAYYSVMGITDAPIAKDPKEYAELAVKLANDKDYYQNLHEQILARNHLLFEADPCAPRAIQLMHDIIAQDLDKYSRNPAATGDAKTA